MIAEVSRIMVSSPGDVAAERVAVRETILQKNSALIGGGRVLLWPLMWEDMVGGYGIDPQDIINRQIKDFEVFIGILWSRFGTETGRFGSGTEEEFFLAVELAENRNIPFFFFYKEADFPANADLGQLEKVRNFKSKISRNAFFKKFVSIDDLKREVDVALTSYIIDTSLKPANYIAESLSSVNSFVETVKSKRIFGNDFLRELARLDARLTKIYRSAAISFCNGSELTEVDIHQNEEKARAVVVLLGGVIDACSKLSGQGQIQQEAVSQLLVTLKKFEKAAPFLVRS